MLMLFDLTQLFLIIRCFVVILVLLSMAWIPIINSFSNSQLFVYIQSISSFLTPPVAATFLMAIFWHRTTEPVRFSFTLTLVCNLMYNILQPKTVSVSLSVVGLLACPLVCVSLSTYISVGLSLLSCLSALLSFCISVFLVFFCLSFSVSLSH